MDDRRDHQRLFVRPEGPPGQDDEQSRDRVPPSAARKKDGQPPAGGPYDPESRVLHVLVRPRRRRGEEDAVLGEGVDDAPGGDDDRVDEFLGVVAALEPGAAEVQRDEQQDAVSNERRSLRTIRRKRMPPNRPQSPTHHDEVGKALACVVAKAKPEGGDESQHDLDPRHDHECLAQQPVHDLHHPPRHRALPYMQLQEYPASDLGPHVPRQPFREPCMRSPSELPSAVVVAELSGDNGDKSGERLQRDVPARSGEAKDRAKREEDAPSQELEGDVEVENRVYGLPPGTT